MQSLISEYNKKKSQIKKRLRDFKNLQKANDEDIFSELCFCILTPQTKATSCDRAIKSLKESGLLFKGCKDSISKRLRGLVRFHNNKASYIVAARKIFKKGKDFDIKDRLNKLGILGTRDWLVKNIKGLGYKEASHFLRNVGMGKNLAIIDRHITRNLKNRGVISEIPNSISKRVYLQIEDRIREFSDEMKIPVEELDLLFWSGETGFIFK